MKKTLFCLIAIILSASFVTSTAANSMIPPVIANVKGGWGIKAEIGNGRNENWTIELQGDHIFMGNMTKGSIGNETVAAIRTPVFPPAFGFGKITIIIKVISPFGQVEAFESFSAIMIGPLVFNIKLVY